MNESERMRILEMLEQGKITAAEAADLLNALGGPKQEQRGRWRMNWMDDGPPAPPRTLKIKVTDQETGRVRANVAVPIHLAGMGFAFGRRFKGFPFGVDLGDDLMEAVRSGRRGTVFDVSGGDGSQRVEISID